jgi:hypothetical protein
MRKKLCNLKLTYAIVLVLSTAGIFTLAMLTNAASQHESPHVLKAVDILSKDLLSGGNYTVDDAVENDGYMNMYTMKSRFGEIKVTSTAVLKIRAREFDAIAKMSEVEKTDSYADAVEKAGKKTISGVKTIVTQPVQTVKGAVSGVGKLFKRAGESFKSEKGAGEDNSLEQMIGFSEAKREVAKEFGVDVYSSNKILQEHLESIAWANFGGKMSLTVLKAFVPGGVGIALSVSDNAQMLNDTIMSTPPSELKMMNRKKLTAMGIDPKIIEILMDNPKFTPRYQTQLVAALDEMKETEGRDSFVKFAALTKSEDVAFFRQRSALKYAAYNKKKSPIKQFIPIAQFVFGVAGDTLVFIVPVDYLVWSEDTAQVAKGFDEKTKAMPEIKKKELWLSGSLSPMSREQLTSMGWKIFENSDEELLADFLQK